MVDEIGMEQPQEPKSKTGGIIATILGAVGLGAVGKMLSGGAKNAFAEVYANPNSEAAKKIMGAADKRTGFGKAADEAGVNFDALRQEHVAGVGLRNQVRKDQEVALTGGHAIRNPIVDARNSARKAATDQIFASPMARQYDRAVDNARAEFKNKVEAAGGTVIEPPMSPTATNRVGGFKVEGVTADNAAKISEARKEYANALKAKKAEIFKADNVDVKAMKDAHAAADTQFKTDITAAKNAVTPDQQKNIREGTKNQLDSLSKPLDDKMKKAYTDLKGKLGIGGSIGATWNGMSGGKKGVIIGVTAVALGAIAYGVHKLVSRNKDEQSFTDRETSRRESELAFQNAPVAGGGRVM